MCHLVMVGWDNIGTDFDMLMFSIKRGLSDKGYVSFRFEYVPHSFRWRKVLLEALLAIFLGHTSKRQGNVTSHIIYL